jgi:hypothetical protein
MQWTLDHEDRRPGPRDLDAARSQLVIVQPGARRAGGVNVALYAAMTNSVGQSVYQRSAGAR